MAAYPPVDVSPYVTPSSSPAPGTPSGGNGGAIAGGVVGTLLGVGLLATGFWYYKRRGGFGGASGGGYQLWRGGAQPRGEALGDAYASGNVPAQDEHDGAAYSSL